MLKKYILYPFIIGVYPVLFLYSHNISKGRISLYSLLVVSLIFLAGSVSAYLFFLIITKNSQKAALGAATAILIIILPVHVYKALQITVYQWVITYLPSAYSFLSSYQMLFAAVFILLLCAVIVLTFHLVLLNKNTLGAFTGFANTAAVILIMLQMFILITKYTGGTYTSAANQYILRNENQTFRDKRRPDIYYLIFDRYADQYAMKTYFNYSNDQFITYLRTKGFYVADNSHTNYPRTKYSLASSLNMEYLPYKNNTVPTNELLVNMTRNNQVQDILKRNGYTYIHFSSPSWITGYNNHADRVMYYGLPLDDFSQMVIGNTLIYLLLNDWINEITYRNTLTGTLRDLPRISESDNPKFVFAHLLVPHPPYLFDEFGNPLSNAQLTKKTEKQNYISYVKFINKNIMRIIDKLLTSKNKPIIIIQADEGPYLFDEYEKLDPLDTQALQIRTGILNAYYIPDDNMSKLYPTITPVNSFRFIFTNYFGLNFPLLPDITYHVPVLNKDARFTDVTQKLLPNK